MTVSIRIALPSMGEGGLEAQRSGHFGHCDCFTVVDVTDGVVEQVTTIDNPPHEHGGCLAPVQLLAAHDVQAIIVGGMGARPLAGFQTAGIRVFYETETGHIGTVVEKALAGELPEMDTRFVCGGSGGGGCSH
jgi:predicted Fe-Mo cluster-binding NifX family protein